MATEPASNNRLKQRLVGAIVLVSLAVIFIPMLLGGRGGYDSLITKTNIPPHSEAGRKVVEIPLHEPPSRPQKKPVTTVVVDEYTEALPKNFVPAPAKPERERDVPRESIPPQAGKESIAKPAEPRQRVIKGEQGSKGKGGTGKVDSWVVQLGSFSDRDNAMVLRDRIRSKKYPAYVEAVATAQGTIYRVRVGPERTRARAEALQARLRKVFNLNGMVFPHKDSKQ